MKSEVKVPSTTKEFELDTILNRGVSLKNLQNKLAGKVENNSSVTKADMRAVFLEGHINGGTVPRETDRNRRGPS